MTFIKALALAVLFHVSLTEHVHLHDEHDTSSRKTHVSIAR